MKRRGARMIVGESEEGQGTSLRPILYAVPVFVRILPQMDTTGTFKHQKVQLRKQGADPTVVPDPLLVLDVEAGTYVPLTIERWTEIASARSKL